MECVAGCRSLLTTKPASGSLKALLWLRELSINPGEVLVWSEGNLIQLLSKMKLSWSGADGWNKSHEISLNLSKAVGRISFIYV